MKANIGNRVFCLRDDYSFKGIVLKIYDNSILVEINESTQDKFMLSTNKTVVNHKNYKIVN